MAEFEAPKVSAEAVTVSDAPARRTSSGTSEAVKLWGDFQLMQRLGEGAFGEVYRAWDPVLEREVALKLLLPSSLDAEQQYQAVVAEARAIAKVRHPNIVSVYGVDRRDGRVGFWSDFVRGRTLTTIVETEGPMAVDDVCRFGIDLCAALTVVHAAGLLHRDIKASNAMRDESGRVVLMDFGLSQDLHIPGLPAGTPKYMAPELRRGARATVQSDVYAMGVLLLYLASGRYPLTDKDKGPELAGPLGDVLRKATDADRAVRFLSAAKLAEALSAVLLSSSARTKQRWTRIGLGVAIVAVIAAGVALRPRGHSLSQAQTPLANLASEQDYEEATAALARYDKPGNTAKAVSLFQKAIDKSPDDALARAGLAQASWRMYQDTADSKWVDQANKASAEAIGLNPNLAAVQMTAGTLHVNQGKFDLGLQELQRAVTLDTRSADVHAALSEAYRQQGRMPQAKAELQNAIDLDPDNWRWHHLLGADDLDSGDLKAAETEFKTALDKAPDNARVLYNLGLLYMTLDRFGEADRALDQAITLAPTSKSILALGSVLVLEGKYLEATGAYRKSVALDASSWMAWAGLAEASSWGAGDPQEASKAYQNATLLLTKALKNSPDDPDLVSRLGEIYATQHNPEQALPLLRRSLLLAPESPDVLGRVGVGYEQLGQRQKAIELISRALQLGMSVDYAKKAPSLRALRRDPKAPQLIRE